MNHVVAGSSFRIGRKDVAQRQAASRYLKDLVELGVLKETKSGKEKLFINPKLMQLLSCDSKDSFRAPENARL